MMETLHPIVHRKALYTYDHNFVPSTLFPIKPIISNTSSSFNFIGVSHLPTIKFFLIVPTAKLEPFENPESLPLYAQNPRQLILTGVAHF